jgi:hypothetical protein
VADNMKRYGFRFYKGQFNPLPKGELYHVADAYQALSDAPATACDLNIGDPVKAVGDGSVALAISGDPVLGIVIGVHRIFEATTGVTRPADRVPGGTTGGGNLDRSTLVEVVPAKGIIWEIDVSGAPFPTELLYRGEINGNAEHFCGGDFSIAGRPKADPRLVLPGAVGAGLGWRIVGVSKSNLNKDFSGANVKLLVKVNDSSEAGSAATTVVGLT